MQRRTGTSPMLRTSAAAASGTRIARNLVRVSDHLVFALTVVQLVQPVTSWNHWEKVAVWKFATTTAHAGKDHRVLDVGGRAVQGSARPYFERLGSKFVSMDIQSDKSVDVVNPPGERFPFDDGHFDIVITTSTFEHDPCSG